MNDRRDPWGEVITASPLVLRLSPSDLNVDVAGIVEGLTVLDGDTVGLHWFGSRLYVAHVLERP